MHFAKYTYLQKVLLLFSVPTYVMRDYACKEWTTLSKINVKMMYKSITHAIV